MSSNPPPITGENAESTVNKQGNADGESTQPKQSRRDLLEAWKAQKEARKAAEKAAKQTAATPSKRTSDMYAIVPSAIHQKCKEHSATTSTATTPQKQPPTLLQQQHAAQASKLLSVHKAAPSAVPQTAPKPVTSVRRTSIATDVQPMHPLMTPQGKTKPAAKTTATPSRSSIAPVTLAPSSSATPSEPRSDMVEAVPQESTSRPAAEASASKPIPKMSMEQVNFVLKSAMWSGIVDALAIKLLEVHIHRRCISIVRDYCPRVDDDADTVLEKYTTGNRLFSALEPVLTNMKKLMSTQRQKGILIQTKPFKTAYYHLYRAIFEEWHENIPAATLFYEAAIVSGAEPVNKVKNAFQCFCARIRELTQQQMAVRPSLAVGVRKLQVAEGLQGAKLAEEPLNEAAEDASALAELLDDEDQDFGMEAIEEDAEAMLEEQNVAMEQMEAIDQETIDETITPRGEEASQESIASSEDAYFSASSNPALDYASSSAPQDQDIDMQVSEPEPPQEAQPQVFVATKPSGKLERLSKTPLGKPIRRVVYTDDDHDNGLPNGEVSTFKLVYEVSKASKKTKQADDEAEVCVTPVRRSNRLALPLRENQSSHATDLLEEAHWCYQPNDALFESGKLEAMKEGATPARKASAYHSVSLSTAADKLMQLNATPMKTPSHMGPPSRVPITNLEDEESAQGVAALSLDLLSVAIDTAPKDIKVKIQRSVPVPEEPAQTVQPEVPAEDIAEHEEAVEQEEPVEPTCTPARRSTRRAQASPSVVKVLAPTPAPSSTRKAKKTGPKPAPVEEPAPEPVEVASTPQKNQDQQAHTSLYNSIRKAARSGAYGSGYVVSSEPTGEGEAADSTPARRSRRIAKKQQ